MKLAPGTKVQVRLDWPEARGPAHIRTPHYVRGKPGVVERFLGEFANPEDLAFNRPARLVPLYHVRFDPHQIWPGGVTADEVLIEIFGHWLEVPASHHQGDAV
jgi:nitrile hydratase